MGWGVDPACVRNDWLLMKGEEVKEAEEKKKKKGRWKVEED